MTVTSKLISCLLELKLKSLQTVKCKCSNAMANSLNESQINISLNSKKLIQWKRSTLLLTLILWHWSRWNVYMCLRNTFCLQKRKSLAWHRFLFFFANGLHYELIKSVKNKTRQTHNTPDNNSQRNNAHYLTEQSTLLAISSSKLPIITRISFCCNVKLAVRITAIYLTSVTDNKLLSYETLT